MPAAPDLRVQGLVGLFRQRYDGKRWVDAHCSWADEETDNGVDALLTLGSESLAIEHTLVEPFPGDRRDIVRLERWYRSIERDLSLHLEGEAIHTYLGRESLQNGVPWDRVARELRDWLREELRSVPLDGDAQRRKFTAKSAIVSFQVELRRASLRSSGSFLIVRRLADTDLPAVVRKVLDTKLPKLLATPADRRLLLLERQSWSYSEKQLSAELRQQRSAYPDLEKVDEVWMVETTFSGFHREHCDHEYVAFRQYDGAGELARSFDFVGGVFSSESRHGEWIHFDEDVR
jgi:hypothetical protein